MLQTDRHALITTLLRRARSNSKNNITFWHDGKREQIDFKSFFDKVDEYTRKFSQLKNSGLTTIGIFRQSDIYWLITDLACLRVGIITLALPEQLPTSQLKELCSEYQLRLVITSSAGINRLTKADYHGRALTIGEKDVGNQRIEDCPSADFLITQAVTESYYTICFSSGTMRLSKALRIPYFLAETELRDDVGTHPKILVWMPFTHFIQRLVAFRALTLGYDLVISTPPLALHHMSSEKPTHMVCAAYFYESLARLIDQKLRTMSKGRRFIINALSFLKLNRLSPDNFIRKIVDQLILKEISALYGGRAREFIWNGSSVSTQAIALLDKVGLQVFGAYGISEIGSISTDRRSTFALGSVGHPDREVKISNEGEILVRGDANVRDWEYVIKDLDGFIHTGDSGFLKKGSLFVEGRLDDIIVLKNGKNIRPYELEGELILETQAERVCVFSRDGQRITAVLFMPTLELSESCYIESCIRKINNRLEPHERIFEYLCVHSSVELGSNLTHSLKLKRAAVILKFGNSQFSLI